jgi:hypothetical protein
MSKKQPKPLTQKEVEALIGHPIEWGTGTSQN